MGSSIPHFRHQSKDPANRHFGFIEADGNEKYRIDDLEAFYEALGYTSEMRRAGILPDEFVWETYTKDPTAMKLALYQKAILDYLINYSLSFKKRYYSESVVSQR